MKIQLMLSKGIAISENGRSIYLSEERIIELLHWLDKHKNELVNKALNIEAMDKD